ncbi:hypothetical protein FB451DRAFT_1221991 [Mycena latifolia]|nr:hypothetical protein FB451DRAFT_1221991 [Mycena latifolia]
MFLNGTAAVKINFLPSFLPRGITYKIWGRTNGSMKPGVRRSHIQKSYKGQDSFEYLVVPIDPGDLTQPRMWISNIPPHLAICTTFSKVSKAWARLTGGESTVIKKSIIERSKPVTARPRSVTGLCHCPNPAFAFDVSVFDVMRGLYWFWSQNDSVPDSFLSKDSDQTMVEEEEEPEPNFPVGKIPRQTTGSSASCYREPHRRLLPSELQQDPQGALDHRLFPSEDGDDDSDDSMSSDSHITGVEDLEEFAKASAARGDSDYEMDRTWLKGIERWAKN